MTSQTSSTVQSTSNAKTATPWLAALLFAWLCSFVLWFATIWSIHTYGWNTISGEGFVTDRWHALFYYLVPILGFALGIMMCRRWRQQMQGWIHLNVDLKILLGILNLCLFVAGITIYPLLILFGFPFDTLHMTTHLPPYTITIEQRFVDLDFPYDRELHVAHADGRNRTYQLQWNAPYCTQFAAVKDGTRTYLRCDDEPLERSVFIDQATDRLSLGGDGSRVVDLQHMPDVR